jgi:hypothetical protein
MHCLTTNLRFRIAATIPHRQRLGKDRQNGASRSVLGVREASPDTKTQRASRYAVAKAA